MENQVKKFCEAKAKTTGNPCRNPAGFRTDHLGEGRCFLHGGRNIGGPKGNTKAVSHGIYGSGLLDDEIVLWGDIEIKTLDDEIRMVSIQLCRAFNAQKIYLMAKDETEKLAEGLELQEFTHEVGQSLKGSINVKRIIRRKRDFTYEIDRLTGRLGDLITKNFQLKGEEIDAREKARQIKAALEEIDGTVPKEKDGINPDA